MANQRQPDVVLTRPVRMMRDRPNHAFGNVRTRKDAQNLSLIQERIVQGESCSLHMPFRENSASNSGRAAARQSEFLADGEMWQSTQNHFLRRAANFRGSGRRKSKLHKIEKKEIAQELHGDAAGRVRVARKAKSHTFIFLPRGMGSDGAKNLAGEIETLQQNAEIRFGQIRIGENADKYIFVRIVKKSPQRIARRVSSFCCA